MLTRFKYIGQSTLAITALSLLLSIQIRPTRYWRDLDKEIFDTKIMAAVGLVLGLYYGYQFFRHKLSPKANYVLTLLLRFGLAFYLISYGVFKIEDATFNNSIVSLGFNVADLSSIEVVNLFFGYTYGYQATLGWLEIVCAGFLMFRRTHILGAAVLTGYFINMMLVGYFFENPHLYNIAIYLFASFSILTSQGERVASVLFNYDPIKSFNYPYFDSGSHVYKAFSILKLLFLAGLFAFYFGKTQDRKVYTKVNLDSPVSGVWKIASLKYKHKDSTAMVSPITIDKEIEKFDRFFLDEGRYGAVRVEDSLSMFEYYIDTNYNQLEFWNFFDFRELDFKGKYEFVGSDTLIYNGLNRKDSMELILVLDKDYKPIR